MARYTVLEIVQQVLASMDSDEVNTISDTVESEQVSLLLRQVYDQMVSNRDLPEHRQLLEATGLSDTNHPNYLQLPTDVLSIEWAQYNIHETSGEVDYADVVYLEPEEFLDMVDARESTDSNIEKIDDFGGSKLKIINDKMPDYWTSFDDSYMVFDSFDSDIESTLQGTKSRLRCRVIPELTLTDGTYPDLDENLFPKLIAETKSLAFVELKQQANPKAEQHSRQQSTRMQNDLYRRKNGRNRYPNYGR